jgi:hypothetical protein
MIDIYSRGRARIRHSETNKIFEIAADELEWEAIGSEERQMGPENTYAAVVDHPELGQLVWSLWEYPVGMENMTETEVNGHRLLENIEFGLQHLPDFDDDEESVMPLALRLALLPDQLDEIDAALQRLRSSSSMIGHNQPPSELRLEIPDDDIDQVRESIIAVRSEIAGTDAISSADAVTLATAKSRLRSLAEKVWSWAKWAGKLAGAGLVTGVGTGLGKELWEDPATLYEKLTIVADTLAMWGQHLGMM